MKLFQLALLAIAIPFQSLGMVSNTHSEYRPRSRSAEFAFRHHFETVYRPRSWSEGDYLPNYFSSITSPVPVVPPAPPAPAQPKIQAPPAPEKPSFLKKYRRHIAAAGTAISIPLIAGIITWHGKNTPVIAYDPEAEYA